MTALATGRRAAVVPAVAAAVLVVDQVTKVWAVATLDDRTIDLVGSLRLNLIRNNGIAFAVGEGFGPLFGVLALVVVALLWRQRESFEGRAAQTGLGLIIGGALGNVVDRLVRDEGLLRGAVVDFVDLQWWPVFNVADAAVTVGVVLLLAGSAGGQRQTASTT